MCSEPSIVTLYDKGIESMFEVGERVEEVKVLNVHMNLISRIENTAALSNLTELDLSSNRLSDLSNLKHLKHLLTLNISNNGLTDAALGSEWPTSLRRVVVSYNELTSISVIGTLLDLQELEAEGNRISNIDPIQNCTNLRTVAFQTDQNQRQCPICKTDQYKALVLRLCPSIDTLDYKGLASMKRKEQKMPQLLQYDWIDEDNETEVGSEPDEQPQQPLPDKGTDIIIDSKMQEAARRVAASHHRLSQYEVIKQKLKATDDTVITKITSLLKENQHQQQQALISSGTNDQMRQIIQKYVNRSIPDSELVPNLTNLFNEATTLKSHVEHLQDFASKVVESLTALMPTKNDLLRQKRDLKSVAQFLTIFTNSCQEACLRMVPLLHLEGPIDLPAAIEAGTANLRKLQDAGYQAESSSRHFKKLLKLDEDCDTAELVQSFSETVGRHREIMSVLETEFHKGVTPTEMSESMSKIRQSLNLCTEFQKELSQDLNIPSTHTITSATVMQMFNHRLTSAVQSEQIKTTKVTSKCVDLQREVTDLKAALSKLQQIAHFEVVAEEVKRQYQELAKVEAELRAKSERQQLEISELKNEKHKLQMQVSAVSDELRRRDLDYEQMRLDLRKRYSTDASSWDTEMRNSLQELTKQLNDRHQQDLDAVHKKYERALSKISNSYKRQKSTIAIHQKQLRAISDLLSIESESAVDDILFEKVVENIISLKSTTTDNISHIQRAAALRTQVTRLETKLDQLCRLVVGEPFSDKHEETIINTLQECLAHKQLYSDVTKLIPEPVCDRIRDLQSSEQQLQDLIKLIGGRQPGGIPIARDILQKLNTILEGLTGDHRTVTDADTCFGYVFAIDNSINEMKHHLQNTTGLATSLSMHVFKEKVPEKGSQLLSEICRVLQSSETDVIKTVETLTAVSRQLCYIKQGVALNNASTLSVVAEEALKIANEYQQLQNIVSLGFGEGILPTVTTMRNDLVRYKQIYNQVTLLMELNPGDLTALETELSALSGVMRNVSGGGTLSNKVMRLATDADQQKRFLSEKERLIEHLLHEIDIAKDDIETLHSKLESSEEQNARVEHNLKDSMRSLEKTLKEKVSTAEKRASSYKRELDSVKDQLSSETETLAGKLRQSQQQIDKMVSENHDLNSQVTSVKAAMRKKVLTVADALEKEKRQRQQTEEQLEQETLALANLQRVSESDRLKNKSLQEQVVSLRHKISSMEDKHRKLQDLLQ